MAHMETASSVAEVLVHNRNRVCRIEINRPEKKNALTRQMYAAMAGAINGADADPEIRAILLHGSKDCFCAGNDLKEFQLAGENPELRPAGSNPFMEAISLAEKPMVAAVTGPAIGIGTTCLFHFDLIYAGQSATFSMPFVRLGLSPEAGSSFLLPRLVGHQRAAEILLLSKTLSSQQALDLGIINAVLPDNKVIDHAWDISCKLAQQPPASVRLTKALLKKQAMATLSDTMADELQHFARRLESGECKEALSAFFERREPDFSSFE